MDRRQFIQRGVVALGVAALAGCGDDTVQGSGVARASFGPSPYGPLRPEPDANGLFLPEGFSSRVVAVAGEEVGSTGYRWHAFPDGAATFADGEGGWYYVCNSEVRPRTAPAAGGVSAIRFASDGEISAAYRILEGSTSNCAGGPTPWGTWLSCEEDPGGQGLVFECDPTGEKLAVAHEAIGRWTHEAAAVDPDSECVYLTEDHPEGLLYRFTPASYPDLSAGALEACVLGPGGAVSWVSVSDPSATSAPTRTQADGATTFAGGEGIWYHDGWMYFTTKLDHSVHGIDVRAQTHRRLWSGDPDGLGVEGAGLSHVDNITVDAASGNLIVAEDGGNMELVIITVDGALAPLLRVHEQPGSEMTGPTFSPDGQRLYFSSQRATVPKPLSEIIAGSDSDDHGGGITYEVTGPFRRG